MEVIINDQVIKIDIKEEENVYLDVILEEIDDFLMTKRQVCLGIKLNGIEHSIESERDKLSTFKAKDSDRLEVIATPLNHFMQSQLATIHLAQQNLVDGIQKFAKCIETRNAIDEHKHVLEELKDFFEFWTTIYRLFPEISDNIAFEEHSFPHWLNALSKKLNGIVDALQASQYAAAAQQLLYEFVPTLEMIKLFIPEFQKALSQNEDMASVASSDNDSGVESPEK